MPAPQIESVLHELERLERDYHEKRDAVFAKLRERLNEIDYERRVLAREESEIRAHLGGDKPAGERKRRSGGPRVSSDKKRETIARLIAEGHIKNGGEMSKGLRSALKDEGFNAPDFATLQRHFPEGWTIEKNGQRGPSAKTFFRRAG